jgi:hypothetical protein
MPPFKVKYVRDSGDMNLESPRINEGTSVILSCIPGALVVTSLRFFSVSVTITPVGYFLAAIIAA